MRKEEKEKMPMQRKGACDREKYCAQLLGGRRIFEVASAAVCALPDAGAGLLASANAERRGG